MSRVRPERSAHDANMTGKLINILRRIAAATCVALFALVMFDWVVSEFYDLKFTRDEFEVATGRYQTDEVFARAGRLGWTRNVFHLSSSSGPILGPQTPG